MSDKTPVMILKELCTRLAVAPPEYELIDHVQIKHYNEFIYNVYVLGTTATGKGSSKKHAKQDTAWNALSMLKDLKLYDVEMENMASTSMEVNPTINYIGELGNLCVYYKLLPPAYPQISEAGPAHAKQFTYECHLVPFTTRATANTKKQARQIVAKEMINRLADVVPEIKYLMETSTPALCEGEYRDLSVLSKINLGIQVQNYNQNLRDVMNERKIQYDDIKMYLEDMDEAKLAALLEKLEMKYSFENVTEDGEQYITVILDISSDIPLSSIAQSVDLITAKNMALTMMSEVLAVLLKPY